MHPISVRAAHLLDLDGCVAFSSTLYLTLSIRLCRTPNWLFHNCPYLNDLIYLRLADASINLGLNNRFTD